MVKMDGVMTQDLIEIVDAGLNLPAAFKKSDRLVAQLPVSDQFFSYPTYVYPQQPAEAMQAPPPRDNDEAAWGVRTLDDQRDLLLYKFGKRLKVPAETASSCSTDEADSLDVNLTPRRKRRRRPDSTDASNPTIPGGAEALPPQPTTSVLPNDRLAPENEMESGLGPRSGD